MANFQNNSLPGIPGIPTAPPPTSNTMPAPPGQVQGYNPYGYNPYGGYDNPQQNWKPPMNEYAPPPPSEHPPPPPTQ